jgi:hypothetical protein
MRIPKSSLSLALALASGFSVTGNVFADNGGLAPRYEVTITNLTRGQQFTPVLVASHRPGVKLFMAGEAASAELATLAEEGNTAPLAALLQANPKVQDTETSAGLLDPGKSVTVTVEGGRGVSRVSLAAMLIPTNDGFIALNDMPLPRWGSETFQVPVYDSGSERNDESCASIPGPSFEECGGPGSGGAPVGGEEGFVHIHSGIHGIGDLKPEMRDWRNPAARVTIRRVSP